MFRYIDLRVAVLIGLAAPTGARAMEGARGAPRPAPAGMVSVPAGSYRPLYGSGAAARAPVAAFAVDRGLVTRGDFLRFVTTHPAWRRGAVPSALAESGYLADWAGPLDAGGAQMLRTPVTQVSWYAAQAYCEARGERLPTTDEWEYLAAASEHTRDATRDPSFLARVAALYASHPRGEGITNVYGVAQMHAPVWEWTRDDGAPADDTHAMSGMAGMSGMASQKHELCAGAALGATTLTDYPAFLRAAMRAGLTRRTTMDGLGFRCAFGAAGA